MSLRSSRATVIRCSRRCAPSDYPTWWRAAAYPSIASAPGRMPATPPMVSPVFPQWRAILPTLRCLSLALGAPPRGLLRGGRECRQFTDVARIVLDDDGGFEIRRDLLEAIDRGQCRCVVGVESGHTVAFVIFPKVLEIATEQHVAHLSQPDQQAVMAGRMSRRVQHDDGAVAEHIFVQRHGFDLAAAADPIGKRRGIGHR